MRAYYHGLVCVVLSVLFSLYAVPVDAQNLQEIVVHEGQSIQSAIDQAEDGATLLISKGIYKENIVVTKSITLKGEEDATIDGQGQGNVITLQAPQTTIEGLKIINSGTDVRTKQAAIRVESSSNSIHNNVLEDVLFGVYIHEQNHNTITNNTIFSYSLHFSKRGNGIHLYEGENNVITHNHIKNVQDGIYFDFARDSIAEQNTIQGARYAMHVMFAQGGYIANNTMQHNINGFMIMSAADFTVIRNIIQENVHFRGYGVLIFNSKQIELRQNKILYNSIGLSLQDAHQCTIVENTVAGNHIGLDLQEGNKENILSRNNFMGNVVQTKIFSDQEPMEQDGVGNYWDDYRGLDLSGDKIGEFPYQSGTMFDLLVNQNPEFQFYFESPSIKVWSAMEHLFPVLASEQSVDRYPLVQPVTVEWGEERVEADKQSTVGLAGVLLLLLSSSILYIYRKNHLESPK